MPRLLRTIAFLLCGMLLLAGCSGDKDNGKDPEQGNHDHGADPAPGGAGPEDPAPSAIVNTKCPITSEPIDPTVAVDYKDKKVAFCCADCIPEWEKLSEAEKEAKLRP